MIYNSVNLKLVVYLEDQNYDKVLLCMWLTLGDLPRGTFASLEYWLGSPKTTRKPKTPNMRRLIRLFSCLVLCTKWNVKISIMYTTDLRNETQKNYFQKNFKYQFWHPSFSKSLGNIVCIHFSMSPCNVMSCEDWVFIWACRCHFFLCFPLPIFFFCQVILTKKGKSDGFHFLFLDLNLFFSLRLLLKCLI